MIVLMLYYVLQRRYRQTVPADASVAEQRTTRQTILRALASYPLLIPPVVRVGRCSRPV
jgi:hypothetical protein